MNVNFIASWRPDTETLFKKADAQKVAEEIYSLGRNPQVDEILEMAKDESKEIHKLIEWDDTIAAQKFRIVQVRKITHNLEIVEIGINNKNKSEKIDVPLKALYHLKDEGGYRPTPLIIEDENLYNKLLMTAKSELASFVRKYSILTELEPVFKAIRDLDN